MISGYTYVAFHKPYGVLSQFTREVPSHSTLADYLGDLPSDIYPIGRLDKDSEGLLLLSNDKQLVDKVLNPKNSHRKTYWVQVDGEIDQAAIDKLKNGIDIRIKKNTYHTLPASVISIPAPNIPDRDPPIRYRKEIPTSWVEIKLQEGKNRQVRKMCAAVGYPVLRLIRTKILDIELGKLKPGEYRFITQDSITRSLHMSR